MCIQSTCLEERLAGLTQPRHPALRGQVGIIREDYSRYKFLKEQLQAVEQQQQQQQQHGRGRLGGEPSAARPSISP